MGDKSVNLYVNHFVVAYVYQLVLERVDKGYIMVEPKGRSNMGTQTVRISKRTHQELVELSRQAGESMSDLIARAVEELRRKLLFEKANAAYAALRSDPSAWEEEIEDRNLWEGTLADGLEDEDICMEAESAATSD
jgi:hypothetical protein